MMNIKSSALLSLFAISSLCGNQPQLITIGDINRVDLYNSTIHFAPNLIRSEGIEEKIDLGYDKEGFFIKNDNEVVRIPVYDTNTFFHKKNQSDLIKYAMIGKFKISRFSNGEYAINPAGGLNGGGVGGAALGAHIGMVITNVVGHGILLFVSSLSGPAAPAVYTGLVAAYGPAILATSKAVAIGVGIAGGVATGPV
jgi:hypothetical protein